MKALALVPALLLSAIASATVRTVSNSPSQPAQYTDLQTAINAAASGDTLYVLGTGTAYGSAQLSAPLTIIGSGYAPPPPAQATVIPTIYLYAGAAGSKVMGVDCTNQMYVYSNNITLERCRFNYISPQVAGLTNFVIRHNYIYYCSLNYASSALVANNIFHSSGYLQYSNSSSVVITNNLFMTYYWYALTSVSGALVTNNIFWQSVPGDGTVTGCTFNNNITFQTANDALPFGTNAGTGNLVGVDPQFTNAPNNTPNLTYDYNLLPASAGNNTGTDGTDIGIYGGPAPWPNQNGLARIPRVTEFNLQFTQVPQGGTVDGTVKAKKVD